MGLEKNKSDSNIYIKIWLFYEGILDVVISCAYRVVVSLNDVIKSGKLATFVLKIMTYFSNKITRYYIRYFDQKNKQNNLAIFWPFAFAGILINLIFDFTYNFLFVYRSLNNKISWLSNAFVVYLAYAYMLFSSLDSCYQNSISWYGILKGGFDDSAIKYALNIFFLCVGLLEGVLNSLYFVVTTKMTLLWCVPICILLYFLPPFLQKFIDLSVIKNCVSNAEASTYDYPSYKLIAGYIVLANVVGLGFQLSSFTANISSGLPWLSAAVVTNIAICFITFYIIHMLITSGYTCAQYIFGVDFVTQLMPVTNIDPSVSTDLKTGANQRENKEKIDFGIGNQKNLLLLENNKRSIRS